jgi:hypothetical protein
MPAMARHIAISGTEKSMPLTLLTKRAVRWCLKIGSRCSKI